jgi:hypothetical protein
MLGDIVGIATVKEKPEFTKYLFGDTSEVAGKTLRVLEKNTEGDCLCIDHKGTSLVDIDHKDILVFIDLPRTSTIDGLMKAFMGG